MSESKNTIPDIFHPLIREWFNNKYPSPTAVQSASWPEIAAGKHVLITAPTGSGKTLTAFLWALNQLITGAWPEGNLRILYISPAKALNNDIQRNLLEPLTELKAIFKKAGVTFPRIKVMTRSGDTPQTDRRQMQKHPPEILITTPESLNLLLSSVNNRKILTGLGTVILDEIHAVAGNKRGTHLITAVDRLVPLAGEFQRIAISATVKPLESVAGFIGGYNLKVANSQPVYQKREVSIINPEITKKLEIKVKFPENARQELVNDSWWPSLIRDFKEIISKNRSTLFFANSKRMTEKVTRLINENEESELAYTHHGALSREIRTIVENRLKAGELAAIISTNSLELGIDIGDLDEVILIQTPPSISSAVQRLGRAGHYVGQTSRGALYPTHGKDFLEAAVMAGSVMDKDIETIRPVSCPLDILAQIIVSMTGVEEWDIDDLYANIRTSAPYHDLSRKQFDLVIEMLAGRYADSRIRELKPRVYIDKIDNTIRGRDNILRLVYMAGGTIPDRGYFNLRIKGSDARLGELDEEFVWERSVGDVFTFGTQAWKIVGIDHQNVEVTPSEGIGAMAPFWKAETRDRDFHFAEKVSKFLENADKSLDAPEFRPELAEKYFMSEPAVNELLEFLRRQKEETGLSLPHRHHLVIEHYSDPMNTSGSKQVILHTLWGGKINRPYSLALAEAWEEEYKYPLEVMYTDDCIILNLTHEFDTGKIFKLVSPENIEDLLRRKLERTGFFGARFRENAARALLLPRQGFNKRMPLWLNRLRSKKLLGSIMAYPDFPVLLETWRTCLQDEIDLENTKSIVEEIRTGEITVSETYTQKPSPFSGDVIWKQTNKYMYEDDTPASGTASGLTEELLKEIVFSPKLRPRIPEEIIASFQRKIQRTMEGYAPGTADELLDWLRERLLIPEGEWTALLAAVEKENKTGTNEVLRVISDKAVKIKLPGAKAQSVTALENLPRLLKALRIDEKQTDCSSILPDEALSDGTVNNLEKMFKQRVPAENGEAEAEYSIEDYLGQWLRYYGPVHHEHIADVFGLDPEVIEKEVSDLAENGTVVIDYLGKDADRPEICDSENLEILLRLLRTAARPVFKALPVEALPQFLAAHQGLLSKGERIENLQDCLDKLFGYPARAVLWETEIIPARLETYYGAWLDTLMNGSELLWFGCGKERLSFCFASDLELFALKTEADPEIKEIIPGRSGRYSFPELIEHTGLDTARLTNNLWSKSWEGKISCDSFAPVRKGIETRFKASGLPGNKHYSHRGGLNRWKSSRPFAGNWFMTETNQGDRDALEEEELIKDRIRILFSRYGILFRELLVNEPDGLKWGRIFRTLRLMELSGEILVGNFFEGVSGAQFISHAAFRSLKSRPPGDIIYWLNAADPASLCGIGIEGLKKCLPRRIPGNHLVYHGRRLVLVSRSKGKVLGINVPPEDQNLKEYFGFFRARLSREFKPPKLIRVETVNGLAVTDSPYMQALIDFGFTSDFNSLVLRRSI